MYFVAGYFLGPLFFCVQWSKHYSNQLHNPNWPCLFNFWNPLRGLWGTEGFEMQIQFARLRVSRVLEIKNKNQLFNYGDVMVRLLRPGNNQQKLAISITYQCASTVVHHTTHILKIIVLRDNSPKSETQAQGRKREVPWHSFSLSLSWRNLRFPCRKSLPHKI